MCVYIYNNDACASALPRKFDKTASGRSTGPSSRSTLSPFTLRGCLSLPAHKRNGEAIALPSLHRCMCICVSWDYLYLVDLRVPLRAAGRERERESWPNYARRAIVKSAFFITTFLSASVKRHLLLGVSFFRWNYDVAFKRRLDEVSILLIEPYFGLREILYN